MAADPRLANLPALRKLAEEEARAHHAAWETAVRLAGGTRFLIEETIATRAMLGNEEETAAHLALLCDLTRPASRDAVALLVAESVRLDVAGGVVFTRQARAGRKKGDWLMLDWNGDEVVVLRDTTVTDPAEALTMIALKVLDSPIEAP